MGAQQNNAFSQATAGESGDNSGVPGVTQTNGKGQSVPQIDPKQAMQYFQLAGQQEVAGIAAGNTAYQSALKTAAMQMNTGYAQADNTLQPLSSASQSALTLFQQMLGITPASTTADFGNEILNINPSLTNVANLINQANAATNPNERASLQQQVSAAITNAGTQGVNTAQAAITALGAEPTMQNPGAGLVYMPGGNGYAGYDISPAALNASSPDWQKGPSTASTLAANQAAWQNQLTPLQQNLTEAQAQQTALQQMANNWNTTYTPTQPQAFTGAQASAYLANTPGYQFQLQQGNEQILRNQAAVGNLGTGNTQVDLMNYGQGLAQNTYNNYMGYLQNLITTGLPATTQLAANQANQGGFLANLTNLGGQATNAADTAEGQALGNASNLQGQTAYNAAALNTDLQMQAFTMNSGQQASQMAQAMNLASSLSNQQQSQNNLNATGQGFYQAMNSVLGNAGSYSAPTDSSGSVSSNGGSV